MVTQLANAIERLCLIVLSLGFAGLIVTVAIQVLARSVFLIPIIWTLDVAQLLFSWMIFLGAAVAYRRGGHYVVDLVPAHWRGPARAIRALSGVLSLIVLIVLLRFGWQFMLIGLNRQAQSLPISEAWYFAPIPLGAALMLFFSLEALVKWRAGEPA